MNSMTVVLLLLLSPVCRAQTQNTGAPAPQAQVQAPPPNPQVEQAMLDSIAKLKNGDAAGALQSVEQALRLDPYIPQAYAQRAIIRLDMKDWPNTIADATQALKMGLKMAVTYNVRARAYIQSGMDQEALADVQEALKLEPENAEAYFNRGQAKEALRFAPDDFLSDYKNASLIDPSFKNESDGAFARFPGPHNIVTLNIKPKEGSGGWIKWLVALVFAFLVVMTIREQLAKRRDSKMKHSNPPAPTI